MYYSCIWQNQEKGINLDEADRLSTLSNKICYLDLMREQYEKPVIERLNSVERLVLNILKKMDADI